MPTPVPVEYTPELLGMVLGTFVSLVFLLAPKLNVWFAKKEKEVQQSIMGLSTIVIGLLVFLFACTPSLGFTLVLCPAGGFQTALLVIVFTAMGNQSVYRVIPTPKAVRAIKAAKVMKKI